MKKNQDLPKLRIDTKLKEKMDELLAAINQNEESIEISMPQFRRMAYKYFVNKVRGEGLSLDFRFRS